MAKNDGMNIKIEALVQDALTNIAAVHEALNTLPSIKNIRLNIKAPNLKTISRTIRNMKRDLAELGKIASNTSSALGGIGATGASKNTKTNSNKGGKKTKSNTLSNASARASKDAIKSEVKAISDAQTKLQKERDKVQKRLNEGNFRKGQQSVLEKQLRNLNGEYTKLESKKRRFQDALDPQIPKSQKPIITKADIDASDKVRKNVSKTVSELKAARNGKAGVANRPTIKQIDGAIKGYANVAKNANAAAAAIDKEIEKVRATGKSDAATRARIKDLTTQSAKMHSIARNASAASEAMFDQRHKKTNNGRVNFVDAKAYTQATNAIRNYNREIVRANNATTALNPMNKAAINASSMAIATDKMADKASKWYQQNERGINRNSYIRGLYDEFQSKMSAGAFTSKNAMALEFAKIRTEARKAGVEVESFGSKLSRTFGSRIRSAMAGYGVFAIQGALTDIIHNAIAVDTAMTELKKVTDATDKEYAQFLDGAADRAKKIGASLADVVSATADYGRLGYNIPEATQLADSALIYKNVGDDVESIDVATKALISTMQGFGIESKKSMEIVDMFNEVSNNYASSAGDIGQITQRSAASMAAAGNSLAETVALGVTANEVQQDADVVGTALKTMSMRLRGSKSELESSGLDTEGMASSVSTLRNEILALTGTDIMLDSENFKSSYDILIGIGEVWDGLTDVNRANVSELLFGKRQITVLSHRDIRRKTHLIAGKTLEPCTTIVEKSHYDGLTTQGLVVHAAKFLSVAAYGKRSETRAMSARRIAS